MKTKSFLYAVAVTMLMASCGSSKTSQNDQMMMMMMQMMQQQNQGGQQQQQQQPAMSSLGQEVAKSPAQLYAEDPKAESLRAWAFYNGFSDDQLEAVAADLARGNLSNSLTAFVQNALENFVDRLSKQGLTSEGIAKKKVKDDKTTSKLKVVSEGLIQGSKVVKANRYRQADGTETAYVCVELDPSIVADKIRNEAEIINAISDSEAMKIAFKSKMFDETMADTFEQFRAAQAGTTVAQ